MPSSQTQNCSLLAELPEPTPDACKHSARLVDLIRNEIEKSSGRMPFDRYMELALYAPGLGYYTAGARKFGEAGDFVTAPEISPLFAHCVARQCNQVFDELGGGDLLEVGAGTGALATDLLLGLETLGTLPRRYLILEVSPDLRERQHEAIQARAPHLLARVEWLDLLPEPGFRGMVVANELLDAMPVSRFRVEETGMREGFVCWGNNRFQTSWGEPSTQGLTNAIASLQESLAVGYESEINLRADYWLQALSRCMDAGAVLLIDYGYPRSEYYHPQRSMGTLLCHYRHRAHDDPFILPGLQDITAHVDFTAVAKAGLDAGFKLAGYTTQAHFLLGCGLDSLLMASDPNDIKAHMTLMQGVKRLTMPTEMGERFKAVALTREVEASLIGFSLRDLSGHL
ncbi:SAM-dependent methyltransferase, MidA [hydrothermal vent metagenome]|uniref:SAM-dependent methyltransferase, MidA n=1 Tax=hydrothermal vent metagenome TaxID=652676 RepID=A0A3B1AWF9_9ZZZZ